MSADMNFLYYGDNLTILREHVESASVDLIYLDPPFNSNASYNVLFQEKSGEQSEAQSLRRDNAEKISSTLCATSATPPRLGGEKPLPSPQPTML